MGTGLQLAPSSLREKGTGNGQCPPPNARTLKAGQRQSEVQTNKAALDLDRSGIPASVAIELVAAVRPTGQESLIKAIYPELDAHTP